MSVCKQILINVNNFNFDSIEQLNRNSSNNCVGSFRLKVLQYNIRGMNNMDKFDHLKELLQLYSGVIDVIVIGETWIKSDRQQLYNIAGYQKVFSCRPDSQGGGLGVYVRTAISFDEISNEHVGGFYHIHIRLEVGESPFHVHAIYRPPSFDLSTFFTKLDLICAEAGRNGSSIIIGDVNIPINRPGCPAVDEYTSLLSCYNFSVTNTYPTRPSSGNILDHVTASVSPDCSIVNETIYSDVSDHCLVMSTFSLQKPIRKQQLQKTIVCNLRLNEAFQNAMNDIPEGSAETRLQFAMDTYKLLKEKFSKTVSVEAKVKGFCPWMSFDVWKLMKIKENVLRNYKRNPNNNHCKELLDHISKKLQRAKNHAKQEHFKQLFANASQRNVWKNVNRILGKDKKATNTVKLTVDNHVTSDGPTVANAFNDFFCSIGPQLATSIHSNRNINKFNTLVPLRDSIYLQPATEQEVILVIKELDKSKSCGVDGISPEFVKHHHNIFAVLLCDLFNECISMGTFPNFLKIARVIPIHKGGSTMDVNNYRPISILSVLSKVLEKLLVVRVANFLRQHDVLYNRQYGFREGSSTWTAVCELVDEIYGALDKRSIQGVLFIDLKKAFDTIDHRILLRKLEYYGIRGVANELFKSYLSGRMQYVSINGATSMQRDTSVGVPQGSNVGPLLFLLYINDLANLRLHGNPRLFADDTSLSYRNARPDVIIQQMKKDLMILQEYFAENMLSMNLSKTKFMLCHSLQLKIPQHMDLVINSIKIDKVTSFKYLGLTFDPNLRWSEHISVLQRELSAMCGIFWKVSKFMPKRVLLDMYHAFIQSKLQYLVSIWGAATKTALKPLQTIQNRCLKIIYQRPWLFPTVLLYNGAAESILPIPALREKECLVKMHNMLTNPRALHNQPLHRTSSRYPLRSQAVLTINRPNTEAGKKSFLYFGSSRYNALPSHLKAERNMGNFKKRIASLIKGRIITYIG